MNVEQSVIKAASLLSGHDAESINLSMTAEDLAMDSLDQMEMIMVIEEDLEIEVDEGEIDFNITFQELVDYINAD